MPRKSIKSKNKKKEYWACGKVKGNTGKTTSDKQKMCARENVKKAHEATKKPVLQFDKKGNFIAEYESAKQAMRVLNLPNAQISAVCKGKRKSTYGFIFKFKEG